MNENMTFYIPLVQICWLHLATRSFVVTAETTHGRQGLNHPLLSTLKSYDTFEPQQLKNDFLDQRKDQLNTETNERSGIHNENVYFLVRMKGEQQILNLTLNNALLSKSYSASSFTGNSTMNWHTSSKNLRKNHCYYQGTVIGMKESHVAMSTCNGLRGCILLADDFLIIEPILTNRGNNSVDKTHVIYRSNDVKQADLKGSCASKSEQAPEKAFNDFSKRKPLRSKRDIESSRISYVELMIIADSSEARKFSTRDELEARIKELINYVDAFYHELDIRVVLSHLEVWNNADRIQLPTDAQQVLDRFLEFRAERLSAESIASPWVYADNFHLIFGRDFDGATVGIASSRTMCSIRSGGVTQDTFANVINTASIVAHELGHNFGLFHDTANCSCPNTSLCIMAQSAGFNPASKWSSCSRRQLQENFLYGLRNCLVNVPVPQHVYWTPACGNDIIEEGEECDCGHAYDCASTCCNPATCKLLPEAECDAGVCCSECRFVRSGVLCREAANEECDIEERCTGSSPHCPVNSIAENGILCNNGSDTCYDGICLSRNLQCQMLWGEEASSGNDICYTWINTRGLQNGNCGYDENGNLTKCKNEDAKCGKLQCSGGSIRPLLYQDRPSYKSLITTRGSGTIECKTIGAESARNDVSYQGLVRDGTLCGDGKVCMDGKCVSRRSSACPFSCYGHGRCSNHGHCHCDAGWEQPYCKIRGTVGTECGNRIVDSGEECDCGRPEECASMCCNATTCRFLLGLQCDGGECCSECSFSEAGTICRYRNNNICDLHEYCNGTSAHCPADVYSKDGTPCNNGQAVCQNGVCLTRDLQCQQIWGGSAASSSEICYKIMNGLGRIYGNCGFDANGNFIACSKKHALCGTLQCMGGRDNPVAPGFDYKYHNRIQKRSRRYSCRAAVSNQLNEDSTLKGSVKDGTICAPGKICLKGICTKENTTDSGCFCSGHGHCDNHGHCHCDRGWAFPDCAVKGTGYKECGNHILDEGEECDCGHVDSCNSDCCNATTCMFLPGTVCDKGECCENCQYASSGIVCRANSGNECDLDEHCTGYSANCPENVFIENGTPCLDSAAYCYQGVCRTHDLQCKRLWGNDSSSCMDVGYTMVNALGNRNGNCGIGRNKKFISCSTENAKCGKLLCTSSRRTPIGIKNHRTFVNKFIFEEVSMFCQTVGSKEADANEYDKGLVHEGTACSLGKMCVQGQCVAAQELTCSAHCNGHGVCNHLGHCHCDHGWAPPHCETRGSGGSIDSDSIHP